MSEIKGYLLTEEEEKECVTLVKKMRQKKVFIIDFSGCVKIKARTREEANNLFWEWVGDLQDETLADWSGVVASHFFEDDGIEEE